MFTVIMNAYLNQTILFELSSQALLFYFVLKFSYRWGYSNQSGQLITNYRTRPSFLKRKKNGL